MSMRYTLDGTLHKLLVECEQCLEEISDARDGNVQWTMGDDGRPLNELYFTHKRCCHAFETTHPGKWGALGLDVFVVHLRNTLQPDWPDAEEKARMLASL